MTAPIATILPNGKTQFIDQNGVPLVGGSVYFYIPSTTTFKTTWVDPEQVTPNTNPVPLDSRGQAIIYGEGQYRQVVEDVNGNTIWDQLTASTDYGLLQAANNLSDVANPATALANLGAVSLQEVYPVGSIYISTSSTNPATTFGFGTWAAFAQGLVLVGVGTGTDSNSNTQTFTEGTQVGEYTHTTTVNEMPAHSHADNGHSHGIPRDNGSAGGSEALTGQRGLQYVSTQVGYANLLNTGGGLAHNNVQPSIGVYMWNRTA